MVADLQSALFEKGGDWSSAHLLSHIRGNSFEGGASPVKYEVCIGSIVFMMPAHILTWGERPKRLLIAAEAGYESFKLPSGAEDVVYFDRAPEKSRGPSFLAFEVPPAPPNIFPVVLLAGTCSLRHRDLASVSETWSRFSDEDAVTVLPLRLIIFKCNCDDRRLKSVIDLIHI